MSGRDTRRAGAPTGSGSQASGSGAPRGILVTGATGNVGSEVCRYLAGGDRPVFGAVREHDVQEDGTASDRAAARLFGAEPRRFELTDPSTWAAALEGADRVFLVRPPHISRIRRDMMPFLSCLADREIARVVFLSVQGAESNSIVPHRRIERAIRDLDLPYTFLRPSFFMQNLTTTHLPEIRDEHRIFVPAGDGTTNFVDVRDIGEAAAIALCDDAYHTTACALTGAESYTYHDIAARLSRILGTTVVYESARLVPFLRYHFARGRSLGHTLVMYALYSVTRLGKAGGATDAVERITGRQPRSLDEFIRDHRDVLAAAASRVGSIRQGRPPAARGASG